MTAADAAKKRQVVKDPMRYKTVLCNKFQTLGKCPYGPRCQFAHGDAELRQRQPLSQTEDNNSLDKYETVRDTRDQLKKDVRDHPRNGAREQLSSVSPPSIRRLSPSPPPLSDRQHSQHSEDSFPERCVDAEPCELGLHELTGQVLCRRDASHNTLSVRRTISFLLNDDAENSLPADLSTRWNNKSAQHGNALPPSPFGFDWTVCPIDSPNLHAVVV